MQVSVGPPFFRPHTSLPLIEPNFFLIDAGLGDQIGMLTSLVYLATTQHHVRGTLYYQPFMLPIIQNVFNQIKRDHKWDFKCTDDLKKEDLVDRPLLAYQQTQNLNGGGAHIVDLGFIHFACMNKPPAEWTNYMKLDLTHVPSTPIAVPPYKYFCMTPGAMWVTKQMPPTLFNSLQDYCIKKYELTPVYLGKRDFKNSGPTLVDDGYDLTRGVDLLDRTGLLECAKVIEGAEFVIGIDNGLSHLTAMTDTPLINGYTISGPDYVRPRRVSGNIFDVEIPRVNLSCLYCQQMKFVNHHVRTCMYHDTKCLTLLADNPMWKRHIDKIMNGLE